MEIWKNIINFDSYSVSNLGRVKNNKTNRILKQHPQTNGYLLVSLSKNNIKTTKVIHRLVGEHFIENPHNLPQINHIDKNKRNNKFSNLEWCTGQYNIDYSFSKKVIQCDLNNKVIAVWKSASEAGRNGFNQGKISACCRGESTSHKNYKWILEKNYDTM